MIAVFAGFMLEDDAVVKSMGFALAASILFDAFIVRMALIPAVLYLLGEKAWWLPAWLDRILPNVDVEGASLERDSIPIVADRRPRQGPRDRRGLTAVAVSRRGPPRCRGGSCRAWWSTRSG